MAKTKRYTNFREFYEDEGRPRGKPTVDSKREKNQNLNQYKYMDPKDLDDEKEFDENDTDTDSV
jgi:hypothetical protein